MNIKITEFGKRHFDKNFSGTKILDYTPEKFIDSISFINDIWKKKNGINNESINYYKILDGYAPFCKLLIVDNFTDARVGSLPITLENYQYLRSGYSARRDSELPVFSRWFELPVKKPKADYLVIVLYSKEQIDKESLVECETSREQFVEFDADYGVVAILGQSHPNEELMKPETMLRNALGINEGGSGVSLNKEKYLESVNFWSNNATVK